jgi:hypothetical protein
MQFAAMLPKVCAMVKPTALFCLITIAACVQAAAAGSNVTPLAPRKCGALATSIGKAIGIDMMTSVGAPTFPSGIHGSACLMKGRAIGLTLKFEAAAEKIETMLPGWTHLLEFDADGPYSTIKGFKRGSNVMVYSIETNPPRGTCKNLGLPTAKYLISAGVGASISLDSFNRGIDFQRRHIDKSN